MSNPVAVQMQVPRGKIYEFIFSNSMENLHLVPLIFEKTGNTTSADPAVLLSKSLHKPEREARQKKTSAPKESRIEAEFNGR